MNSPTTQQALLLDVGNQRTKWRRLAFGRGTPIEAGVFETRAIDSLSEDAMGELFGGHGALSGVDVAFCCVAGEGRAEALCSFMSQRSVARIKRLRPVHSGLGDQSIVVRGRRVRLRSHYASTLGADRWAAALGVVDLEAHWPMSAGQKTLLVVSAGSATVIDGLRLTLDTSSGRCLEFLGGFIGPGFLQMKTCLASGTADLAGLMRSRDQSQRERPTSGLPDWPTQSADAIDAGIEMGQLAPLAWITRPDGILVHGGAARDWMNAFDLWVARHWTCPVEHCPELIFSGLRQALEGSFDID